jgi:hypothetical protein
VKAHPRICTCRLEPPRVESLAKAWIICPGFVDTDVAEVVPGTTPLNFLRVGEVVDLAQYLIRLDYNVKLGPEILIRTMRNR